MSGHRGGFRSTALGALLCLFVVTSGCVGVLTGSEPFVATASEVGVSGAALGETDFQHKDTQTAWLNRTVEAAGQEREVRIRNYVSLYQIPVSMGVDGSVTFGLFSAVSTPQVSIAGQALNPIGQMSHTQLIEQVAGQSGDVRNIEQTGSRTLPVLGTDAEVTKFAATAVRQGQEVPVYIEVTRLQDGEDYVVAVGVYPQDSEDVPAQVETLFTGIEH